MPTFQELFGSPPTTHAHAPGRVNLLGEHTDYNDGFVLPTAIPQQTVVHLGLSRDGQHHFYSQQLDGRVDLRVDEAHPQGFARYLLGCIRVLEQRGIEVPPLNIWVTSTVPMRAGLSSSAALEVAVLRGLRSHLNLSLDDVDIALLGQQAERDYAGVQCGIMDQMAASLADTEHLLFLDTRTLERQLLSLPKEAEILVLHSGIQRQLADSGYNQRRAECEAAARQLGVTALRDIQAVTDLTPLPAPLYQRARHVVTENQRVLMARQGLSAQDFGTLMNDSHASLRDDYQVSVPGLDTLVDILQTTPGVYGARLTGAGFGGACVALVRVGVVDAIATAVLAQYQQTGYQGHRLVPQAITASPLFTLSSHRKLTP
jgi:galactokinase